MTPVAPIGEALYGPRWRTELAQVLGVNERTVRRWEANGGLPDDYLPAVRAAIRERVRLLRSLA